MIDFYNSRKVFHVGGLAKRQPQTQHADVLIDGPINSSVGSAFSVASHIVESVVALRHNNQTSKL